MVSCGSEASLSLFNDFSGAVPQFNRWRPSAKMSWSRRRQRGWDWVSDSSTSFTSMPAGTTGFKRWKRDLQMFWSRLRRSEKISERKREKREMRWERKGDTCVENVVLPQNSIKLFEMAKMIGRVILTQQFHGRSNAYSEGTDRPQRQILAKN